MWATMENKREIIKIGKTQTHKLILIDQSELPTSIDWFNFDLQRVKNFWFVNYKNNQLSTKKGCWNRVILFQ